VISLGSGDVHGDVAAAATGCVFRLMQATEEVARNMVLTFLRRHFAFFEFDRAVIDTTLSARAFTAELTHIVAVVGMLEPGRVAQITERAVRIAFSRNSKSGAPPTDLQALLPTAADIERAHNDLLGRTAGVAALVSSAMQPATLAALHAQQVNGAYAQKHHAPSY
jgi:hypothetical protein